VSVWELAPLFFSHTQAHDQSSCLPVARINACTHLPSLPPVLSRPPLPQVRQGGGPVARAKHEQRGKLYVRERIERLVDPGTPFLELSALAGREMYGQDKVPAGGIVTGK